MSGLVILLVFILPLKFIKFFTEIAFNLPRVFHHCSSFCRGEILKFMESGGVYLKIFKNGMEITGASKLEH